METGCNSPAEIAEDLAKNTCVKKANTGFIKLLVLGILAGAYIGFGAALSTLAGHDAAKYLGIGMTKLIMGATFSVGLMLVVIAGGELFTGNNLIMLSLFNGEIGIGKLFYNWIIVFFANLIGSLVLAYIMFYSNLWKGNNYLVGAAALNIANIKVSLSFTEAFTRGILCNWLVCLAVWMAFASKNVTGKIFAVFFPVMAFVALGFEHSIANMYFIPEGIMLGAVPEVVQAAGGCSPFLNVNGFIKNIIPVTLGNVVGGAFFVSFFYWFSYVRKNKQH